MANDINKRIEELEKELQDISILDVEWENKLLLELERLKKIRDGKL